MYYIQNVSQGSIGNPMLWWKKDNHGYTCEISDAKVFIQEEVDGMYSIQQGNKRAWPKEYIDGIGRGRINIQDCDIEKSKPHPAVGVNE